MPKGKGKAPPAAPMESALAGEAALTFRGDRYLLALNMPAIERFETATDKSLVDLFAQFRHPGLFGNPRWSHLGQLLRAALVKHHGDGMPDDDRLLAMLNGKGTFDALKLAIQRAFPEEGEAEGEPVPAAD